MIKFAVCDDEAIHVGIICEFIEKVMSKTGLTYVVFKYLTAAELLNTREKYDILLLDINLDSGADGIKLGQKINEGCSPTPIIILVTSLNNRVYDGYHTKAHRFITKPIDHKVFTEAIISAISEIGNSKMRLKIKQNQTTYFIPIPTIEYIEGFKKKKIIHTQDSDYSIYENREDILPKLPPSRFFQIHQSFCISLEMVLSINQTEITLKSGKTVSISRGKKKEFVAALNSYLEV